MLVFLLRQNFSIFHLFLSLFSKEMYNDFLFSLLGWEGGEYGVVWGLFGSVFLLLLLVLTSYLFYCLPASTVHMYIQNGGLFFTPLFFSLFYLWLNVQRYTNLGMLVSFLLCSGVGFGVERIYRRSFCFCLLLLEEAKQLRVLPRDQ